MPQLNRSSSVTHEKSCANEVALQCIWFPCSGLVTQTASTLLTRGVHDQ